MTEEQKASIVSVLVTLNYDVRKLMGNYHKKHRQQFMTLIVGEQRPLVKCGVNALIDELALLVDLDLNNYSASHIPNKFKELYL